MNYEIKVIRSRRKSISLEITKDCEILVRAPLRMPQKDIELFVKEKSDWLEKHLQKAKSRQQQRQQAKPLTEEELHRLAELAKQVIPVKAAHYANLMQVDYGRITIRNQKTRWGSCSAKGNLNFNCLLMLLPSEIVDYVVVHELCHRKEMNHSPRFWAEVERILPDYKMRRKWLKEEGEHVICRVFSNI